MQRTGCAALSGVCSMLSSSCREGLGAGMQWVGVAAAAEGKGRHERRQAAAAAGGGSEPGGMHACWRGGTTLSTASTPL